MPDVPGRRLTDDFPPGDQHLREHTLQSERVYDGVFMHINRDRVRVPDGVESVREYTLHPGAAMIIPVLADGRLLMERQYRYPLDQVFLEFPAGKLDPHEPPLVSAQRELLEETGYTAERWSFVTRIHPVISYSTEFIDLFLAEGLTAGAQSLDPGEVIDLTIVSLDDLLAQVRAGQVTDVKTIIGALWLDRIRSGQWQASPV